MVDCCLMMDAMNFAQNSVEVSCDWNLARLRLRSGGGGGRFSSFSCIQNLNFSARWSESTMLSVTPAFLTVHSLSLFVMIWSNWWGLLSVDESMFRGIFSGKRWWLW